MAVNFLFQIIGIFNFTSRLVFRQHVIEEFLTRDNDKKNRCQCESKTIGFSTVYIRVSLNSALNVALFNADFCKS